MNKFNKLSIYFIFISFKILVFKIYLNIFRCHFFLYILYNRNLKTI